MKRSLVLWILFVGAVGSYAPVAKAEQHRATRLGNPATRFAPTIFTTEDLRSRFRDEKLQKDMISVLQQWGWKGDPADLFQAARVAPLTDMKIPVGTTMPFMSSREKGKPICLRNVLWAGNEPAPAYSFYFSSKGQRYRCVTPKACSNFFVEDLGPEPKPLLALECSTPGEVFAGRPVEVCLTVRNSGTGPESGVSVSLPVPPGAKLVRVTGNGVVSENGATWEVLNLAPKAAQRLCAYFAVREPMALAFNASASGQVSKPVQSACSTRVLGVPGILLEVVDLEDPIQVGHEVTYDVRVTNQGSAPGTNIRLACQLPGSQEYVSGTGATVVRAQGRVITTEPLAVLAPKAVATWRVVVKALHAADSRFRLKLTSDQFQKSIDEEESTEQY